MLKNLDSVQMMRDDMATKADVNELNFGMYLRRIREAKKISVRQLAKAVKITPTYLSDIEKGNNKPPNCVLLKAIIKELQIENNDKLISTLFDLAAKERNDIPADIKEYIMNNQELLKIIRTVKNSPNEHQLWSKVSEFIV